MVSVLTLVFAFRSSAALAYAFGMAVIAHDHHHHVAVPLPRPGPLAAPRCGWSPSAGRAAAGRPAVPGGEPDQARARRVAAAAHRPDRVHRHDHLAARPGGRHPRAGAGRRARCGRSSTSCTSAGPRCCRSPGTAIFLNRGKDSAPLAMRANVEHNQVRHQHVVILSIETRAGAHGSRTRSGSRSTTSAGPATGSSTSARTSATWRRRTYPRALAAARPPPDRGPDRRRPRVLLPLDDRADEGRRADDGALAQAAVHRDVLHHGGRRRVLQPAPRPLGDHGVADRGVAVPSPVPRRPARRA